VILLLDIGNTHTHVGVGDARRLTLRGDLPTAGWRDGSNAAALLSRVGAGGGASRAVESVWMCSVVPSANAAVRKSIRAHWRCPVEQLGPETIRGVGIRYPRPETIGQDRLANAVAARHHFGAPVVVVDFGTAVTFDVVDARGNYVGGIIAPGLAAMTDYLHEKTALLPRIEIREPRRVVGTNTRAAMLSGAVFGYRGLVRELIGRLRRELDAPRLPVVATGGYARLMARGLPEIDAVMPGLTLEGLRLTALA
jgi:type III pantothenate kinase